MKILRFAAVALIIAPFFLLAAPGRNGVNDREAEQRPGLPAQHRKWLDEEVVYIITRTESDVFLKLQTDRERDLFIEAFWKQRDPTPDSPDNEFKVEHYRRINYANHFFGRTGARPGWKTDRGRIYTILGEPNDIQRFQGRSDVVPSEIWFYQGKTDLGLPPGFHVVFFQEHGHGEFRLYSPATDGPMALLTGMSHDPADYISAYKSLRDKEPALAEVSLSLIPGEGSNIMGRPSLSSDILIQRIESTPQRQVEETYAEKFLRYKDIIEVEYTANYLDSESLVKVFKDPSGISFIHFALEPKRLSVNQFEAKYYTTLKLNGSLALAEGKIVYQYDRTIDLKFEEDRMPEVAGLAFAIHDILPAVPGEYRLSVLVKNEASKEFSTLEQTIRVPPAGDSPQITPPLLGYKLAKLEGDQRSRLRAFQFGENIVYCQPNRVFVAKDNLVVALQVFGLNEELKRNAELRLTFLRDGKPFREIVRRASELPGLPDVVEEISLADFPPYHYELQAGLFVDGLEAAKSREEFDLTYRKDIARPWVHSRVLPEGDNPMISYILGIELANLGRLDEALGYLEKANARQKNNAETVTALAQIYLTRGKFEKITPLVEPLIGQEKPTSYEVLYLAGRAFLETGEFGRAQAVFDKAVAHYGVNARLLNALGECYEKQGKIDEALAAWRKSLELSADQPDIRQRVESLTGKN